MTADNHQRFARACRDGLEALDHVLEHKPDHVHETIATATRCMVRVRDALIEARRADTGVSEALIAEVNALLSVLVASEFPLVGVRWQRLKQARDYYNEVITRVERHEIR